MTSALNNDALLRTVNDVDANANGEGMYHWSDGEEDDDEDDEELMRLMEEAFLLSPLSSLWNKVLYAIRVHSW